MAHSKSEILHVPYEHVYEEGFEDMPRRVPDIGKIAELIGFRPSVRLEGILSGVPRKQPDKTRIRNVERRKNERPGCRSGTGQLETCATQKLRDCTLAAGACRAG